MALVMIVPVASAGTTGASRPVSCPSPTVAQIASEVSQIPKGSHQILSIWWTFTNLEDIEISPYYWALDAGVVSLQVWQAPDGSFWALESVALIWQTYAGALSPVAGVAEPHGGAGPEVQAGFSHSTGLFTPGSMPTHGYLGNVNLGGTKADILAAPGPQSGTDDFDPFSAAYFNNGTGVVIQYNLAWSYFYFPTSQEFCGTYDGITGAFSYVGDIVT
jgi:hypothetical protein